MSTITPRMAASVSDGFDVTVLTISAATSSSRPRRIAPPMAVAQRLESPFPVGPLPRHGGQADGIPGAQHHRRNAQHLERLRRPFEELLQVHCVPVVDLSRDSITAGSRMVGDDHERQASPCARQAGRDARRASGAATGHAGRRRRVRSLLRPDRQEVAESAGHHSRRPRCGVGGAVSRTAQARGGQGPRRDHDRPPRRRNVPPRRSRCRSAARRPSPSSRP